MASFKEYVRSNLRNAEKAGKQLIAKTLDEAKTTALSKYEINTDFVNLRDFYDFIRQKSGINAPTTFWYFSPCFYAYSASNDGVVYLDKGSAIDRSTSDSFFSIYSSDFARFRYCIQSIDFPKLELRGATAATGQLGSGYTDISTIFGGYTVLNNSYVNASQHTFTMKILNTQKPVIEEFIYPWMQEACRTDGSEAYTQIIPKVNMAVKFYGGNTMLHGMEGVAPDFIYYMTGIYPVSLSLYHAMQSDSNNLNRDVTFVFNDLIVLNSQSDATKFNLAELYVGNAINTGVDVLKEKILKEMGRTFD